MQKLPPLNLPKFTFRFKRGIDGEALIFDSVRKKWLVLTPEEWVRQNLIQFLISNLKYPESMFKIETGLRINQKQKRSDAVVYKGDKPFILIECKAMNVNLSDDVMSQALNYNLEYNCPFIILSNGVDHLSVSVSAKGLEKLDAFPVY